MSITIKSRKAKARKLQDWIAEFISKITKIPWGRDELISPREMGQRGVDVKLLGKAKDLFSFSVEAKNQERWSIHGFIKHAKQNKLEGTDWLLFCKRSRENPIVVMDAVAFFHMYEKYIIEQKKEEYPYEDKEVL